MIHSFCKFSASMYVLQTTNSKINIQETVGTMAAPVTSKTIITNEGHGVENEGKILYQLKKQLFLYKIDKKLKNQQNLAKVWYNINMNPKKEMNDYDDETKRII